MNGKTFFAVIKGRRVDRLRLRGHRAVKVLVPAALDGLVPAVNGSPEGRKGHLQRFGQRFERFRARHRAAHQLDGERRALIAFDVRNNPQPAFGLSFDRGADNIKGFPSGDEAAPFGIEPDVSAHEVGEAPPGKRHHFDGRHVSELGARGLRHQNAVARGTVEQLAAGVRRGRRLRINVRAECGNHGPVGRKAPGGNNDCRRTDEEHGALRAFGKNARNGRARLSVHRFRRRKEKRRCARTVKNAPAQAMVGAVEALYVVVARLRRTRGIAPGAGRAHGAIGRFHPIDAVFGKPFECRAGLARQRFNEGRIVFAGPGSQHGVNQFVDISAEDGRH